MVRPASDRRLRCAAISTCRGVRSSSPIQASKKSPSMYSASAWLACSSRKRRNAPVISGRSSSRCRSEMSRTVISILDNFGGLDNDVLNGNILMACAHGGGYLFDFVDYVHAFDRLAKDCVAPTLGGWRSVVKKAVVFHVDEKLGARGVRVHGACHGDGARHIAQTIVGFVLDGRFGLAGFHPGFEAAALNHEVGNDAVEDQAIIETFAHVIFEVLGSDGGFFVIQLNLDIAVVGFHQNHVMILGG